MTKDYKRKEIEYEARAIRESGDIRSKFDLSTDLSSWSIWKKNLINLGGDYLIWSNSPENPNHN